MTKRYLVGYEIESQLSKRLVDVYRLDARKERLLRREENKMQHLENEKRLTTSSLTNFWAGRQ